MKKHTHFDNEITGAYHYDNQPFFDFNLKRDWVMIVAVGVMMLLGLVIYIYG